MLLLLVHFQIFTQINLRTWKAILSTARSNSLSIIKCWVIHSCQKTIAQVPDEKLNWQLHADSNSIAAIVKHLWGNMLSRWTDFLTSDGEKEWRNREAEFDNDLHTRQEIIVRWNEGWTTVLDTLHGLTDADLDTIIYIRNEGHTVMEAIIRQLAHYPYHVGQLVYIAKMICGENWQSLSIPRGKSQQFNAAKFAEPKGIRHFTDELLQQKE